MALTASEKVAGRRFRAAASAELAVLNTEDPPTVDVPHFIGVYRHQCVARDHRSLPIELKERYVVSPIYPVQAVPAGRFGFIYREGRCRACGQTARSNSGHLVDARERPPLTGHTRELTTQ
jgi:hypothetical protein